MPPGSLRPSSDDVDAPRLPPQRFRELDDVVLRVDLPKNGLKRGDAGLIVHALSVAEAYLVEFVNEDGSTRALVEVTPDQIGLEFPPSPSSSL